MPLYPLNHLTNAVLDVRRGVGGIQVEEFFCKVNERYSAELVVQFYWPDMILCFCGI